MWFYKHRIFTCLAFLLLAIWFVVFKLDWIAYTEGEPNKERCYSPNHEYYVVRLQTPFNSSLGDPHVRGTVKLYDKAGKLLYQARTLLGSEFGPEWIDELGSHPPSVFYLGNHDDNEPGGGWGFTLPTSPGKSPNKPERRCY